MPESIKTNTLASIYKVDGSLVMNDLQINTNTQKLKDINLPAGLYYITFKNSQLKKTLTSQFIKL